jgi:hypothetical protein
MARLAAAAGVEVSLFARPNRGGRGARRVRRRTPERLPAAGHAGEGLGDAAVNPSAARVLAGLGASTINVPTDLTLPQLAAIRAVVDVPLDVYVESPDNLGGFLRHHEIPELVRVCAPVYLKFGLRNAPDVYPAGTHLEQLVVALGRERVRRARLGLDRLARSGADVATSARGAQGLAVPRPLPAVEA